MSELNINENPFKLYKSKKNENEYIKGASIKNLFYRYIIYSYPNFYLFILFLFHLFYF